MKFKIIFTIYLACLSAVANSQKFAFTDISLSKSDFEIKEGITKHPYDAKIFTAINYDYKVEKENEKPMLIIFAKLSIDSDKSWIKKEFWRLAPDSSKTALLAHEKGHLLVAIIQLKELENSLMQTVFSKQQYKLQLRSVVKDVFSKRESRNTNYDNETNHSRIREKQEEWITSLMQRINELYSKEDKIKYTFEIKVPLKE